MADYCRQCSVDLDAPYGWSDFGAEEGREPFIDICEGCGSLVVIDATGACCGLPNGEPCAEGHLASPRREEARR